MRGFLSGATALKITGIYLLFGALWILFSDRLLGQYQTGKGLAFVLLTAGLLYGLVRRAVFEIHGQTEALRRSEARYRQLIQTAEEGICTLDDAGVMTLANPKLCEMLGYGIGELLHRPLVDFLLQEDRAALERQLAECRQRGDGEQDLRLQHKDGRLLWAIVRTSALSDGPDRPGGVLAMFTNITQRREAQAILEQSEARFRAVFDEAGVGIALLDRQGRFLRSNRELQQMLGYGPGELERKTYLDVTLAEDQAASRERYAHLVEGGGKYQIERRYVRRDGSAIWGRHTATSIRDAGGQVSLVLTMIEDITQRKEAVEQVKRLNANLEQRVAERTHELEEANQQLEAYSYSVSHNLRTPLESMREMAMRLVAEHAGQLDAGGQELARRLVAAAARMDRHIEDLLELSRLGGTAVPQEPVSLVLVVTQVLGQLEREVQERHAQVMVQEPLHSLLGHRMMLTQVVTNLLSNAVKFVPPGQPPKVRVWAEQRENWVRMWVEDNGLGIAAEDQKRIFRGFERLQDPARYPGTGLGLVIVAKGLQRMGGRYGVESEPGKGSRFWIELPAV